MQVSLLQLLVQTELSEHGCSRLCQKFHALSPTFVIQPVSVIAPVLTLIILIAFPSL